ncbi:MAG: hypothetical protein IPP59_01115 [Betaproteobacteria bacterium]|nr:hypothetical protein [Candidatus Dechloromonas phosphorivorans]
MFSISLRSTRVLFDISSGRFFCGVCFFSLAGGGRTSLLSVSLGLLAVALAWMSIEQSVPEINHRLKSTTFDFTANSLIEGECDKKAQYGAFRSSSVFQFRGRASRHKY